MRTAARSFAVCTLLSALLLSCSERETDRAEFLLRDLPPDVARHLISDDDSAFAEYCREAGTLLIIFSNSKLGEAMLELPEEDWEHDMPVLIDLRYKIARAMLSEYDLGALLWEMDIIERMSYAELHEYLVRHWQSVQVRTDPDLSPDRKIELLYEYLDAFRRNGDPIYAASTKMWLAEAYAAMGDGDNYLRYLHLAVTDFERYGVHQNTCQALGALGSHYRHLGMIDSMAYCYEKAKRIAERWKLPIQAGRISSFYGGYFRSQGRLSLAHDMYRNAMELCREYKGGHAEARFVVEAMGFYADLSCWDITERLIDRSRTLERLYSDERIREIYILRTDKIEARLLLARGDIDGAERIFNRIREPVRNQIHRGDYAELLHYWATGLLDNGLACRARPIAEDGARFCSETLIPDWEARFAFLLARIESVCGDIEAAEKALAEFERLAEGREHSLRNEWIGHDVLLGRIGLTTNDRPKATASIISGIERLGGYISARDASVHSYLWIDTFEDLRQLMHDYYAADESLGYGVELYWRRFFRNLGSPAEDTRTAGARRLDGEALTADLAKLADESHGRIVSGNATNLLYLIRNGDIWCWTVSSGGISRDILEISSGRLKILASAVIKTMSSDPGEADSPIPAELAAALSELAEALLPESILSDAGSSGDGPLYITSNSFLAQFPFEALNVSSAGGYDPLLAHRDVAYLRYTGPATEIDPDLNGIVLASPEPPPALRKRYPFQRRLGEVMVEASVIAAADPSAIFLKEESATKENLVGAWTDASYIYLAAHTLRDPEVPYLSLIPLSAPAIQTGHEELFLDFTDIRTADLNGCGLFVLSGCSTGTPYCEDTSSGPGLGDACLDAGAHAVIQTFWDVRDDDARALMSAFIGDWRGTGMPPLRAICESRRRAMRGENGFRHPFGWAAYSIKLGRI